jgi:hypothetical protein
MEIGNIININVKNGIEGHIYAPLFRHTHSEKKRTTDVTAASWMSVEDSIDSVKLNINHGYR